MDAKQMSGPVVRTWPAIAGKRSAITMRLLSAEPRNGSLRWLERALIVFGVACLAYYVSATARTAAYQNRANAQLEKPIVSNVPRPDSAPPDAPVAVEPETPLKPGDLIGRVDVPRLNMSAAVAEGDDDSTLGKAVGHLPDTPLPWQGRGNVAFAAHRDGLFRPLKDIRVG